MLSDLRRSVCSAARQTSWSRLTTEAARRFWIVEKYQEKRNYAAFSTIEYQLNPQITLRPSARVIYNTKYKARGVNYGLGMDYKITSSAFAGVEVSSRNLEGCNNSTCPTNLPFEASITILSFRLGYIF